ncbi:DFG10 Polyprenol reductase [Candida maltosa Xu316]
MSIYVYQLGLVSIYLIIVIGICAVKFIKPLNELLQYGKTSNIPKESHSNTTFHRLINWISSNLVVPKSWFTHFYITLFTLSSLIFFGSYTNTSTTSNPVKFKNLTLIHRLLWIQSVRRLSECLFVSKFSPTSKMNISHYLIGVGHYVLVSLATYLGLSTYAPSFDAKLVNYSYVDLMLMFCFGVLSILQFSAHYHLSSLVKYTVPSFKHVASPHYLYEILIYTIFAIYSAKNGLDLTSITFMSSWLFVVCNLTISSLETYKYYSEKFKDAFKLKWAIFPGLI